METMSKTNTKKGDYGDILVAASVRVILELFPTIANDLKILLQMIDEGKAVDINDISEKSILKHLKQLFVSLNLKEKRDGVFLLRSNARPTLEIIGPMLAAHTSVDRDANNSGPSELLAAAAKLRKAEAEAERFKEVTRIMGADANCPYDIVGMNHKTSAPDLKKRYLKLSLLVHPDKCPHPDANKAFIKLNTAFKDVQDPDKRKALDDAIKKKEEEVMKAEIQSRRAAAQWRRARGLFTKVDDILLKELEVKLPRKRDEWMTSVSPERKFGCVPMGSRKLFRTTKRSKSHNAFQRRGFSSPLFQTTFA